MGVVYDKVASFKERYPKTLAFRLQKHSKLVEDLLDEDEKVLYAVGNGRKTYVDVFTDKRYISAHKNLLWGNYIMSRNYDTLNKLNINAFVPLDDIHVHKGLIWSKMNIYLNKGDSYFNIYLSGLDPNSVGEISKAVNQICDYIKEKNENENVFVSEIIPERKKAKAIKRTFENNINSLEYYLQMDALLREKYSLSDNANEKIQIIEQIKNNYLEMSTLKNEEQSNGKKLLLK